MIFQFLKDNSFDVIYCSVVFMHLDEWDIIIISPKHTEFLNQKAELILIILIFNQKNGKFYRSQKIDYPHNNFRHTLASHPPKMNFKHIRKIVHSIHSRLTSDGQWVVGIGERV